MLRIPLAVVAAGLAVLSACGESTDTAADTATDSAAAAAEPIGSDVDGTTSTFTAEVWADNWFALHVNGDLVGEDSVPITTERSFNAETFTFEATYPLTVAIEAKDFKETDSGIEYIGESKQQMGDGGLIVQIIDSESGAVVASDGSWSSLVIHQAPLNTECEKDSDPDATCEFNSINAPDGWTTAEFDDSAWGAATVWDEGAVSPKDGYDEIDWVSSAQLIWGSDLEVDNTVLFRTTTGS
ncbi:MAG: PEBP family protein [Actinomycetota bacterium]